jgi:putative heme iron utilization protein
MDTTLPPEAAVAICAHMNEDHADAVAAYARVFGNIESVVSAEMLAIDSTGMDVRVDAGGVPVTVRIAFDHVLAGSTDARETLIAMARHAMTDV